MTVINNKPVRFGQGRGSRWGFFLSFKAFAWWGPHPYPQSYREYQPASTAYYPQSYPATYQYTHSLHTPHLQLSNINNKIIYIKLIQIELILLLRHVILHLLPLLLLLHLLPQLLHIFRLVNRRLPLLKNTTNHPIRILLGVNFRLLELAIVVLHHLLIEHLPHLGLYSISLHLLVPHPLIVNLHLLVHCLAYETPLELHVFESLLTLQLLVVLEDLLVLAEFLVWVDSLVEKLILVVKVPNLLLPLC